VVVPLEEGNPFTLAVTPTHSSSKAVDIRQGATGKKPLIGGNQTSRISSNSILNPSSKKAGIAAV
jgi:hypothetical protein